MLTIISSDSQKLARAIQRDFEQAAENHRRQNHYRTSGRAGLGIKIGFLVPTVAIAFGFVAHAVM